MTDLIPYAKHGLGLLRKKAPTLARLARELGVDRATLYRWMNGDSVPSYYHYERKITLLAEFWVDHEKTRTLLEKRLKDGI